MKTALKQPYQQFFGTLANQVRLELIELLIRDKSNVTNLQQKLKYDQSTISHSLRRLEECGFVTVEQKGKERIYSINAKTIKPLFMLMQTHIDMYCKHVVEKKALKHIAQLGVTACH
ncbi:winged helix-turn-helix transcriptional regulator [Candidatus Woesearchaeota archaeon]|nr:winged helix-turn-helix transcriptional regulator [Candidatus Woesearchaeota archaeon]